MNQLAILRRHLCILRQVQPPFLYPEKKKLLERLAQEELGTASARTLERDFKDIKNYYGIRVGYSSRYRGYFLDQPADEDLSDFRKFFQLLERCERLAFLTHSTDALSSGKYLLLEDHQEMLSLQHMPILWEALRSQRQLVFRYQAFGAEEPKSYQADPLVLLEYRNRWYLAVWDPKEEKFKTFGLERMLEPTVSDTPVQTDRRSRFLMLKKDALGVTVNPEDEVEQVVLHIQPEIAPYIRTVPIHSSQNILKEEQEGMLIQLHVIVNPELEREILGYGELVEVMEPLWLREKIQRRTTRLLEKYSKINLIS